MSRWLSTVNNLLEKLDGQVGDQIAAAQVRSRSEDDDDDSYYEEDVTNQGYGSSTEMHDDTLLLQNEVTGVGERNLENAEVEEEVDFDAFDEEEYGQTNTVDTKAIEDNPTPDISRITKQGQLNEEAEVQNATVNEDASFLNITPTPTPTPTHLDRPVTSLSDPSSTLPSTTAINDSNHSSSSSLDDDQTSMNNADTTITTSSSPVMVDHPTEASWTTNDDDGGTETNPDNNDQSSNSSGSADESESELEKKLKERVEDQENMDIKFSEEEIIDADNVSDHDDMQTPTKTKPKCSTNTDPHAQNYDSNNQENEIRALQSHLEEATLRHKEQVMALQEIIQALEKELSEEKQTSQSEISKINSTWKQKMSKLKKSHKATIDELSHDLQEATDEMTAQAAELERAGQRMERDRLRHKEELEKKEEDHALTVNALQEEQEASLQGLRDTHNEQLSQLQSRLKEVEEARLEEGGNYEGELHTALEREQKTMSQVQNLQDEKATLSSQVSSLQSQLTSLEHKCANLSSTLETSQQRERDFEDRLDAALTTQTRQLQQRQSREKELEKTVAELGAALVVAKQRETARLAASSISSSSFTEKGESSNERAGEVALSMKVTALEEELQMINAQFELEQQHSATLKEELEVAARERSEDAVNALAKQRQHDRQIAQLESQIANLTNQVRDFRNESTAAHQSSDGPFTSKSDSDGNTNLKKQQELIERLQQKSATLSAQVVKQQERIDTLGSENVASKSRLKAALARAEQAESSLAEAAANYSGVSAMVSPSSAQLSVDLGNDDAAGKLTVPRFAPRLRRRGRTGAGTGNVSIRAALNLTRGEAGDLKESVGQVVDAMDKLSVETGAMLSVNPLARAFFLLYLVVLHLWTFVLLFFHAHYDNMHVSSSTSGLSNFAESNLHSGGHHLFLPAAAGGGLRGGTSP